VAASQGGLNGVLTGENAGRGETAFCCPQREVEPLLASEQHERLQHRGSVVSGSSTSYREANDGIASGWCQPRPRRGQEPPRRPSRSPTSAASAAFEAGTTTPRRPRAAAAIATDSARGRDQPPWSESSPANTHGSSPAAGTCAVAASTLVAPLSARWWELEAGR
jgi:hypothetical protein